MGFEDLVVVVDGVVNKNHHRDCSSVDDLNNDTVGPILILVVAQGLRGARKEGAFEHEGAKTSEFLVGRDGPAVVGPVAGVLCLAVISPTLRVALIELTLVGQLEHLGGVAVVQNGLNPERGNRIRGHINTLIRFPDHNGSLLSAA